LARVYTPAPASYYFVGSGNDAIKNLRIDKNLVFQGPSASVNAYLGAFLANEYHLIEFEFVKTLGSSGMLSFYIDSTSGKYAWITRTRIYVPSFGDYQYEYKTKTTTNFTLYDLYYFIGFADDYICNIKVDSTQWYQWQWNTSQEIIPAWEDGFSYPVFNNKERGLFNIEFTFVVNGSGLLDFQFVSWEMQKQRIGRPKFYMTTTLTPKEYLGAKPKIKNFWLYGNSSWCDANMNPTNDPTDFALVTQYIRIIANGTIVGPTSPEWFGLDLLQEANLGISVGFLKLDPRENDNIDIAIMFNVTSGNLYYSKWEGN
jgi:hypothetical protein